MNGEIKKNGEKLENLSSTPSKAKEVKKLKGFVLIVNRR